MTPPEIELIRVAGTHREVGRQMGEAARPALRAEIDGAWGDLPGDRSKADQLSLAARYRDVTAPALPWLMDELDGCAEGAGVDPLELFAVTIEEIWYLPRTRETVGRCSDLVAGPSATAGAGVPRGPICSTDGPGGKRFSSAPAPSRRGSCSRIAARPASNTSAAARSGSPGRGAR